MFLIVIDAYSKWLEILPTSADTADTIRKLRMVFATHGLPEQCVSDNGSPFTSREFEAFLKNNGIKQIRTSPYHASSNGMAERAVRTFKETLKKMSGEKDMTENLARFLFRYRITPQTTTGKTPAELLMGRRLLSVLDRIRPDIDRKMREKRSQMVDRNSVGRKMKTFKQNDHVYVRNFGQGSIWWSGKVVNRHGPVTWLVELKDGRNIQRHVDHIRVRHDGFDDPIVGESATSREFPEGLTDDTYPENTGDETSCTLIPADNSNVMETSLSPRSMEVETTGTQESADPNPNNTIINNEIITPPSPKGSTSDVTDNATFVPRRSERVRKPPDYYGRVNSN